RFRLRPDGRRDLVRFVARGLRSAPTEIGRIRVPGLRAVSAYDRLRQYPVCHGRPRTDRGASRADAPHGDRPTFPARTLRRTEAADGPRPGLRKAPQTSPPRRAALRARRGPTVLLGRRAPANTGEDQRNLDPRKAFAR